MIFTQRFVAIFEQFDVQILIQSDTDKQFAQFAVAGKFGGGAITFGGGAFARDVVLQEYA